MNISAGVIARTSRKRRSKCPPRFPYNSAYFRANPFALFPAPIVYPNSSVMRAVYSLILFRPYTKQHRAERMFAEIRK